MLLALALLATAAAPASPPVLSPVEGPAQCHLGLYVLDIADFNVKSGTFVVDLYLWLRFPEGKTDFERVEVMNGTVEQKDEEPFRETANGQTVSITRMKVRVKNKFNLKDFPFDSHVLSVDFENKNAEADVMVFVPDTKSYQEGGTRFAGLEDGLEIPQWAIKGTEHLVSTHTYQTDFGALVKKGASGTSQYSRSSFRIRMDRIFLPFLLKSLLPLLIVVLMAFLVFLIPADKVDAAIAIAITTLLSAVALHLALATSMPDVGYMLLADKLFIWSYVAIFVTLVQTIWTYRLHQAGEEERAVRIEVLARFVVPLGYLAGIGAVIVL